MLNYLDVKFVEKDGNAYLTGNWFGRQESKLRSDGAAGGFGVQKVNSRVNIDFEPYFSNLDKLIKKYNDGDTSY